MSEVRLIDANALKYKNLAEVNGKLTYVLTAEEIDNSPTVVPEDFMNPYEEGYERARKDFERPHGEWISKHLWDNTHVWVCSECGNLNIHGITVEKACWRCGADMRGKKDDR